MNNRFINTLIVTLSSIILAFFFIYNIGGKFNLYYLISTPVIVLLTIFAEKKGHNYDKDSLVIDKYLKAKIAIAYAIDFILTFIISFLFLTGLEILSAMIFKVYARYSIFSGVLLFNCIFFLFNNSFQSLGFRIFHLRNTKKDISTILIRLFYICLIYIPFVNRYFLFLSWGVFYIDVIFILIKCKPLIYLITGNEVAECK